MNVKNRCIQISLVFLLIITTAYAPLIAADSPITQSAPCPPCNCPPAASSSYHRKILICAWHILKLGLIYPASLVTAYHIKETCTLLLSRRESAKAIYQITGAMATGYFIYAIAKDSYEGIKAEILENFNVIPIQKPT